MNEPYTPTYNLGWGNHSNLTWSQDTTLGAHLFDQPYLRSNQALNNQLDLDPKKGVNILEKNLEVLAQSTLDMINTLSNFMQTTGQLLN